jgi:hypothetical protein
MAGAVDGPKSAWMDELIEEVDRLNLQNSEMLAVLIALADRVSVRFGETIKYEPVATGRYLDAAYEVIGKAKTEKPKCDCGAIQRHGTTCPAFEIPHAGLDVCIRCHDPISDFFSARRDAWCTDCDSQFCTACYPKHRSEAHPAGEKPNGEPAFFALCAGCGCRMKGIAHPSCRGCPCHRPIIEKRIDEPLTISVNGVTMELAAGDCWLSYEDVLKLADERPGASVVFKRAAGPKSEGSLITGQKVMVQKGTIIDAIQTGSA